MSSLKPFSPPFAVDATHKRYVCYIEVDGQPHEAHWIGEWAVFDFSDTSDLSDFSIHPVQFSAEIREVWSKTEPLAIALFGLSGLPSFTATFDFISKMWVSRCARRC